MRDGVAAKFKAFMENEGKLGSALAIPSLMRAGVEKCAAPRAVLFGVGENRSAALIRC